MDKNTSYLVGDSRHDNYHKLACKQPVYVPQWTSFCRLVPKSQLLFCSYHIMSYETMKIQSCDKPELSLNKKTQTTEHTMIKRTFKRKIYS